jgi:hypothetical protein
MKTTPVEFLSVDYFALVANNPDLAAAFALGDQVIAISGSQVYEVIPSTSATQPIISTSTPTPWVTQPATYTPVSPIQPSQTPTQAPPAQPSGLCGAAFLPLFLVPLVVLSLKKRRKNIDFS